jgi:Rap1a immunity proteins
MKKLLLIGTVVLLTATSASAQSSSPGPSLKTDVWVDFCTSKDGMKKIVCTSYAVGLYDGLILWYANSKDPIKICVPEGSFISATQVIDIGLEYVRRHPDSNPRPIAAVLREAIEEAFPQPCREM